MAEPYVAPTFINMNAPPINDENLNALAKAVESLLVQNGGTGKHSFTVGAILIGNGTSALSELVGSGALFSDINGQPQFDTLPIGCGGTGTTTLGKLKQNMGLSNAGFVVSTSPPSDTSVLWINSDTSVAHYHNGSQWKPIVGVYA